MELSREEKLLAAKKKLSKFQQKRKGNQSNSGASLPDVPLELLSRENYQLGVHEAQEEQIVYEEQQQQPVMLSQPPPTFSEQTNIIQDHVQDLFNSSSSSVQFDIPAETTVNYEQSNPAPVRPIVQVDKTVDLGMFAHNYSQSSLEFHGDVFALSDTHSHGQTLYPRQHESSHHQYHAHSPQQHHDQVYHYQQQPQQPQQQQIQSPQSEQPASSVVMRQSSSSSLMSTKEAVELDQLVQSSGLVSYVMLFKFLLSTSNSLNLTFIS